jgi:protein phosphatase
MSSERLNFEHAVLTECGAVRPLNQDAVLTLPNDGIFVVADGMGGASAGEVASRMITEMLENEMTESRHESPGDRKYLFHQALHKVNSAINAYRQSHGFRSMGSTVVAIIFNAWEATTADVVNCGDSRCYCFRNGELLKLTTDHTLDKTFKNVPAFAKMNHVLTNHIGAVDYMTATWQKVSVCPGDVFLLCSDGLTSLVPDLQIQDILNKGLSLENTLHLLENAIAAGGAKDNYSIVLVRIPEVLPPPLDISEEERRESDLLYQISEQRKDYGK